MVGFFVLGLFLLSLVLAAWKLTELYRVHFDIGSEPWNAHQVTLREELARFSSRFASKEEVRDFERREQAYLRRLELQLEHGNFADEVERLRAQRLEQGRRLEATQTYDALKREAY